MKKVLAVDDNKDILEFIKAVLDDSELELFTASDGEEGLNKAKEIIPDLIILDVEMPKMDGFSVFKELRSKPETQKIPIIMLTGIEERIGFKFTSEEMGNYYGSEPEAYMGKPIDPEKLLKEVEKYI